MADREGLIPGTNIKWRLRQVSDFEQNPTNPVKHSEGNLALVTDSIKRFGALRSGVSSHGKLLAGNLTQKGMLQAGIQDVLEISSDGSVWTVVERGDLTDEEQQQAAYYDQQAAFQATWDADQVAIDLSSPSLHIGDLFPNYEKNALLRQVGDKDFEGVKFKEFDESAADSVEYVTCPQCGHKWPR